DFERREDRIFEEKDRGDIFEIFIEGYLETQPIAQCVKHWIVGRIPLALREKYRLPIDATGIDGIYETHEGELVAYQVKYRRKQELTFTEVAPFLGITEKFTDRVIFTNAEGARNVPPIDIAIFDEAHQTPRLAGSANGYVLSDKNLKIKKRLCDFRVY